MRGTNLGGDRGKSTRRDEACGSIWAMATPMGTKDVKIGSLIGRCDGPFSLKESTMKLQRKIVGRMSTSMELDGGGEEEQSLLASTRR